MCRRALSIPNRPKARSSDSIPTPPKSSTPPSVADQMRIIDTLSTTESTVTIVDVRAGLLSPTLRALRDIGFLDAVKKGQITFVGLSHSRLLHRLAERDRGNRAVHRRRQIFPGQELHQQHQLLRVGSGYPCLLFQEIEGRRQILTIPKLNEMAYEQVELASVPFLSFVANKNPKGEPPITRSCCAGMSGTGSAMSGPSTIASNFSTALRRLPALRRPARAPRPATGRNQAANVLPAGVFPQ
jgi:hypothetical protein